MKVIIEQTAGVDYGVEFKGNTIFYAAQEAQIRKRLELRKKDVVEIREVEKP